MSAAVPWGVLLGGISIDEIRPKPIFGGPGHVDAATALVLAGGLPRSAPDNPLVVVVNDPDRATDSPQALRAVRDACPGRSIFVLVSTGSHVWSAAARTVHESMIREACRKPVEVFWHDAVSPSHTSVGPAALDSFVAKAQDLVGIGSVEPHWFAGLTGAHKTLTVGVMHRHDITASHAMAMRDDARPFRLEGNPVHEHFAAIIRALEAQCRLVVLQHCGPRWFGGGPLETLEHAAGIAENRWHRRVPKPYDFLVAVVAPPLSRTLYQAEKGIKNNEYAVKDGGAILLEAGCEDGLGPDRFFQLLLKCKDVQAVGDEILRKGYRLGDHKAHRLRALQGRGVTVGIVSPNFPASAGEAAGILVFRSRDEAARGLKGRFGGSSRGAIVEDAGNMVVEAS